MLLTPPCSFTPWQVVPNDWSANGLSRLKPNYLANMPKDPLNSGEYFYYYEPVSNQGQFGVTCINSVCDYILSTKLEDPNSPYIYKGAGSCHLNEPRHNYCVTLGKSKFNSP
jgi:hypothetical protein